MSYIGSWKIDDPLTFYAGTHRFDTGNATDADSVPYYAVYEDETGTPLLTGSMALLDSGNTNGLYSEQITLSAASGFEKGKQYGIYKRATVNSVTGIAIDTFQIEAEVDANTVSVSVTANDPTGTVSANVIQISGDGPAADNAESFFDGTGYAGTNNTIPTVTNVTNQVTADVTAISGDATAADNAESFFDGTGYAGTNNVIPTVTTLTGHTAQTGDSFARLGAPAGASVSADVASIQTDTTAIVADTNELQTDWANGGRLDLILDARAAEATVTGLNDISIADVNAQVVDALATDTYAELAAVPAATSTLADKINWLFALARNKITQTATTTTLRNDADGADIATSTVSDDGTTATRGEFT